MNNQCPFCSENNLLRTKVILDGNFWYVSDLNEGSLTNAAMAITKRHIETPFELNEDEWSELHTIIKKVKEILDGNEKADGYNIGWNVYKAGGQNVPHVHLHMIARYSDEPLAGKGIRYAFKEPSNMRQR